MSGQAKLNLKYFNNSEIYKLAYSPLILPQESEEKLKEKWPRKKRQELENRWSFTQMVKEISAKFKGTPLECFILMTYGYRMGSHIAHGDETGIQIIAERDSRPEIEKNRAYRGHFLRLLNDCLCYTIATGAITMSFLNLKKEETYFWELLKKADNIKDLENKYSRKVFDDPAYDKYRN